MAISIDNTYLDATYYGPNFGNVALPSGRIMVGASWIQDGKSNRPRWNLTTFPTSITYDVNYRGSTPRHDYRSYVNLNPTVGTYQLDGIGNGSAACGIAILSGATGNYYYDYQNPVGSVSSSLSAYSGGIAVALSCRRLSMPTFSITSGATNLTLQKYKTWNAWDSQNWRLWTMDVTSTTLAYSSTCHNVEVFTFEASAGSIFIPKLIQGFV